EPNADLVLLLTLAEHASSLCHVRCAIGARLAAHCHAFRVEPCAAVVSRQPHVHHRRHGTLRASQLFVSPASQLNLRRASHRRGVSRSLARSSANVRPGTTGAPHARGRPCRTREFRTRCARVAQRVWTGAAAIARVTPSSDEGFRTVRRCVIPALLLLPL